MLSNIIKITKNTSILSGITCGTFGFYRGYNDSKHENIIFNIKKTTNTGLLYTLDGIMVGACWPIIIGIIILRFNDSKNYRKSI